MSENRCVCCNAVIPEGRQVCKKCEAMAERKTADEMFREMNFRKEELDHGDKTIVYCRHDPDGKVRIIAFDRSDMFTGSYVKIGSLIQATGMMANEIIACYQMIKEMGRAE